jgi:hypothetical protein
MVQTEDGIIDISDYIVSGSVNRVLNEVSTAQLVIRNPFKKFTKPGNPTFHPMDAIQIWGSRYKQHPVQLFTGYLDTTPYLQLFPGTCTLSASCTLKRLLYTYWDPGLPYIWSWLGKWGWRADPTTGTILSPKQFADSGTQTGESHRQVENALLTDGSIGNLLFNFLVDVGNWKGDKDPRDSQVLIEKLPDGIVATISAMMQKFQKDDAEMEQEVQKFFSDLVGQYTGGGSLGGGGSTGGGLTGGTAAPPPGKAATPEQIAAAMLRAGFPCDVQIIANGIATTWGESQWGAIDQPPGGCCHGYWQINVSVGNSSLQCAMDLDCATKVALGLWKNAGNCFACIPGPNPWQGGTDHTTNGKYIAIAKKVINEMCGSGNSGKGGGKSGGHSQGRQHG